MVIGNSTTVGLVALPIAIGAPTVTVVPAGPATFRSAATIVEKTTGLLKVTIRSVGVEVTVAPPPGATEATLRVLIAARAPVASTSPKPPCVFH
jgi:hypothetical protein